MSAYKRCYQPGGHYFFTLVTYQRKPILIKPENIVSLKSAIQKVKKDYPFHIDATVVLPDHLHFLWKLPENDHDFSTRLRLIKRYFSVRTAATINERQEKQIWQHRFWEHLIRDEKDWKKHMDYIHYNPVKHQYVKFVKEWPHSSFHHWVLKNIYDENWGSAEPTSIATMVCE